MDTKDSFPGAKQRGREINHSLPSGAEVKNGQSHTSTPCIYLHGTDKEHFIVSFYDEKCPHNVKAFILYLNVHLWHTLPVLVLPTFLAAASESRTSIWHGTHLFQMTSQLHRWSVGQHTVAIWYSHNTQSIKFGKCANSDLYRQKCEFRHGQRCYITTITCPTTNNYKSLPSKCSWEHTKS